MKAVVVHGARDLRIEDRPCPTPRAGEVLLAMTHGGICGSDLHYYLDGAVGAFTVREPLTLGHEVVGTVADDPSGKLGVGTAVAIHPATTCGSCADCEAGLPHLCRNSRYLGSAASAPHTQGGFTERLVVRCDQIRVLPADLPLARAVLVEPLAVSVHALSRTGGVTSAKVLVSGSGPIGVLTAAAAKAAGAAEVWTTDMVDNPLRIAEKVGADKTVRIGADTLPDDYFDVAVEASGAPAALGGVLASVRRRGVVVQLGLPPGGRISASLSAVIAKEIDFRGTFRFHTEIDDAIAMLAATDRLDAVITHTFALSDAAEAMTVAADPALSGKVVLRLDNR
jgi:L-idonate 5-dehydrogenase